MSDYTDYLRMLFDSGENRDTFEEKIAELFPAIIYVFDVEKKRLKFINKRVSDFLGFTYDDFREGNLDTLIFKDDLELVQKELEKFYTLPNSDSYSYNCRLNHKLGHWRYFRTMGSVLRRKEDGNAASLLFIAQDITEQLKSEEEIKAIQELFDETEELLQLGSWSYDIAKKKIHWTNGLYRLFEFERAELPIITREFYIELVTAEDRAGLEAVIKTAYENRTGFEYEYEVITKNKNRKIVSTKAKVVTDASGIPAKLVGMTRDVTPFRNFERDRERSIRELNRSNRELEEFAYVASHDLQEPLRKISTFSERLKAKFAQELGKEGALYLERILASTENMRILIDNLLEFSRTTRSSRAFEKVDINSIIAMVKMDLELKIEENNAQVIVRSLPKIEAVPSEMKQLFNNLLSNAIKFRKPLIDPVIEIRSEKINKQEKEKFHLPADKEFEKIYIKDNGIGFEEEYEERIFQIFQRLHGKAEYPGSGIGLAICKKIVDNHGGVMYAQGKLETGATFVVILPEKQD
ncbi:MAG TPA: PAS domain-containing protein [Ohtaekwangia sp.]|uniref:sensor histidine kinase n=1 Tax=Ohtaekwangia sp. TaxID=2066019 RepID=UPI002F931821